MTTFIMRIVVRPLGPRHAHEPFTIERSILNTNQAKTMPLRQWTDLTFVDQSDVSPSSSVMLKIGASWLGTTISKSLWMITTARCGNTAMTGYLTESHCSDTKNSILDNIVLETSAPPVYTSVYRRSPLHQQMKRTAQPNSSSATGWTKETTAVSIDKVHQNKGTVSLACSIRVALMPRYPAMKSDASII